MLFTPALATIGSEDPEPVLHPLRGEVLQKLDLFSVERDDPDLWLVDATLDEGLSELAHKLCLCHVLDQITDTQVVCWEGISVNEDSFSTRI